VLRLASTQLVTPLLRWAFQERGLVSGLPASAEQWRRLPAGEGSKRLDDWAKPQPPRMAFVEGPSLKWLLIVAPKGSSIM
jgi:hypothetical protein